MAETLRRKVAIVTGASSGIGYEVTKELASKGIKVYACARRTAPIEPLVETFGKELVVAQHLDIADLSEIRQFKETLAEELPEGKLDILYNNAGQSCTFPALDVSHDVMEQCFKVNVFGHVNMTRELSSYLINAKGTVIFTGSIAGFTSVPFGSIYAATKAAIHQYARVLHLEMKPFGVRVINVVTGGVLTDIADKRDLPEDSIYKFPEGIAALRTRQTMAKDNHPMPANEYAKKVVSDLLSSRDPVDVYRGRMATFLSYVNIFVPYFILEWIFAKKFKLDKVSAAIQKRYAKKE
ncbi:NADPH-dependent 1-acyldihydroxyacetone phosphate reductase [Nakaseomyces bracarensis]|uniref:NADPH-dependent 1-acyldihydroxyacetone phosphate reductase n=1 Tax=Nakaseomyces bracarensis TaxID=273131 RepID=A0ABR4NZ90_9SACH